MLEEAYKTCYGDCAGDRTIHKLSLLVSMFESSEIFEKLNKDLPNQLIIDIDRDVEYDYWGRPETWTAMKSKTPSAAAALTYESQNMDKASASLANNMADMLPPVPETRTDSKDKKTLRGLTYGEREKFKTTINNLMNTEVFNDYVLDFAIDSTLKKLCMALQNINSAINKKHKDELYRSLYGSQAFSYRNVMGTTVREEHTEWRDRHLDDQITEESLQKYLEDNIAALLLSGVFDGIEANETKNKYKNDIDFTDYEFPKKTKPYELYARFRSVYERKDGKYTVNEMMAGKLLFKIRKDEKKIRAFLRFDQILALVYKDIKELKEKNGVKSVIRGIDFSQLECRFSEEEVKGADIKCEPKTILALIDKMKPDKNSYWICFYCVLLEKKWIEENVKGFCKSMEVLFDIKLNSSSFCKEIKKNGTDIDAWPSEDIRAKNKKDFGVQFKECIDFYSEYKRERALADL